MKVDGREAYSNIKHGVIANTETYATGWSMTPGARPDDGVLDVITRIDCSLSNTLKLLWMAIRRKRLPPALARYSRARRIEISSEHRICIQMDGDPMPACKEFSVEVSPRRFQILIPQGVKLESGGRVFPGGDHQASNRGGERSGLIRMGSAGI